MAGILHILDFYRCVIFDGISVRSKNFFVLCIFGRIPVPILKISRLFHCPVNSNLVEQADTLSSKYALLNETGLEHSGLKWISLSRGSRFARALRSWDGIDRSSFEAFGITGAEWERAPARTGTVWTQEICSHLTMAEFQVERAWIYVLKSHDSILSLDGAAQ